MASSGLSFDNLIFSQFASYAAVVLLKTMVMSLYTARFRIAKRVFANTEDYQNKRVVTQPVFDEDVERVRRCHLNDVENVIPFVLLGLLYVRTGPSQWTAVMLFRAFAGCRIMHTIAYLTPLPQPSRALMFFGGLAVNIYMAVAILKAGVF